MKRPEDEILLRDMVDHDIVWTVVTSDLCIDGDVHRRGLRLE